jgi:hypothetical protein
MKAQFNAYGARQSPETDQSVYLASIATCSKFETKPLVNLKQCREGSQARKHQRLQ